MSSTGHTEGAVEDVQSKEQSHINNNVTDPSTTSSEHNNNNNNTAEAQTESQIPPSSTTTTTTNATKTKFPDDLPSPEELRRIAEKQDAKAEEIKAQRRRQLDSEHDKDDGNFVEERDDAAKMIQKNYRGYRTRREMRGYGLDPNMRWVEALKAAKYHTTTQPRSRTEHSSKSPTASKQTRDRWRRVGTIAHHAGSDDTSEGETDDDEPSEQKMQRRRTEKAEREKYAKVMGLEYFLEMVDHKHRYGSNLRRYHVEWKKADTHENFFYWLDHGEGKGLDLEDRPRKRLDTEQVRYLSREERQRYLVTIEDGRFCWVKNDQPITTSPEFRDSINGIVPVDDTTPTWREVQTGVAPEPSPPGSDTDSLSGLSRGSSEDEAKYTNNELHDAKGLAKLNHISADALTNHMLRKTTRKNTWIFVADTSFRLYVGIKQSGAFQHSSFLRGARVSAAGLIKIKNGQLRKISPLSGHYAPPLKNFREFLRSLRDADADLSHLNTSRSYAVLLGLDAYIGVKRHVKNAGQGVKDMVDPSGKREREEASKDNSQSAQRERQILEAQERQRRQSSFTRRLLRRLKLDNGSKNDGSSNNTSGDGDGKETTPSSTTIPEGEKTTS